MRTLRALLCARAIGDGAVCPFTLVARAHTRRDRVGTQALGREVGACRGSRWCGARLRAVPEEALRAPMRAAVPLLLVLRAAPPPPRTAYRHGMGLPMRSARAVSAIARRVARRVADTALALTAAWDAAAAAHAAGVRAACAAAALCVRGWATTVMWWLCVTRALWVLGMGGGGRGWLVSCSEPAAQARVVEMGEEEALVHDAAGQRLLRRATSLVRAATRRGGALSVATRAEMVPVAEELERWLRTGRGGKLDMLVHAGWLRLVAASGVGTVLSSAGLVGAVATVPRSPVGIVVSPDTTVRTADAVDVGGGGAGGRVVCAARVPAVDLRADIVGASLAHTDDAASPDLRGAADDVRTRGAKPASTDGARIQLLLRGLGRPDGGPAAAAACVPTPGMSVALGGGGRVWLPPARTLGGVLSPGCTVTSITPSLRSAFRCRHVPRPKRRVHFAASVCVLGRAGGRFILPHAVERTGGVWTYLRAWSALLALGGLLLALLGMAGRGWAWAAPMVRVAEAPLDALVRHSAPVRLLPDGGLPPFDHATYRRVQESVAQRAVDVARAENASPEAALARWRLANLQPPVSRCTLPWYPSDTALVGRGRELLEGFVWLRRQRRAAASALARRLAQFDACSRGIRGVRDAAVLRGDDGLRHAADAAIKVLQGAARCYSDFTAGSLDNARDRLCGVPRRPRFFWWRWPEHLHDVICIGLAPGLVCPVVPCDMENYATCAEPGTEREQRRLWRLGLWEVGDTVVVAPLGARPKPNNPAKFRMVYDCTMGGLNDWVYKSRFPFPSFSDFTSDYYQGCWLLKNDASDWFYHLNASEGARRLFGVRCPDTGRAGRYSVLPMGGTEVPHFATVFMAEFVRVLRTLTPFAAVSVANPAHTERAASADLECADLPALMRLAPDGGLAADVRVFVDDAALPARSPQQALEALMVSSRQARDMGLMLEFDKLVGPNQNLPVVGLGVDTTPSPLGGYRVYVPDDKRVKVADAITRHRKQRWARGWCTRREMAGLVGALNYLLPAAPLGSAKLRDTWDLLHSGVEDVDDIDYDEWVKLNNAWRSALRWWETLLRNPAWAGTRMRRAGRHRLVHSWADASGAGYGCSVQSFDRDGRQLLDMCEGVFAGLDKHEHSTWKEMQGVVKTLELIAGDAEWAARVRGGVLRHHTDCESVAKCIVKKRAKARKLRKGVDRVLALAAQLDVEVVPVWVSGNAMMLQGCDSGSRSGGLGVFAANAPPAASFLPASTVRDLWTAPLGDYLRMRFGIRFVAFQPAGWSLANLQRRDVAFAPSAALSRRCIVDLLDEIRCDEYRLGATVVLIGGAPSDWGGLTKYFPVQERIGHGLLGRGDGEARTIWILHRAPGIPPPSGGLQRLTVEQQVCRIDCASAQAVRDSTPVV